MLINGGYRSTVTIYICIEMSIYCIDCSCIELCALLLRRRRCNTVAINWTSWTGWQRRVTDGTAGQCKSNLMTFYVSICTESLFFLVYCVHACFHAGQANGSELCSEKASTEDLCTEQILLNRQHGNFKSRTESCWFASSVLLAGQAIGPLKV